MWTAVANVIIRFRVLWLTMLLMVTIFLGWQASQVTMSYEFAKAIPTDNPQYIAYENFKKKFGEAPGLIVIGVETPRFFDSAFFNDYAVMQQQLKQLNGIKSILSIPSAINLEREETSESLKAVPVFEKTHLTQREIDSSRNVFLNLPFYRGLLYNDKHQSWLMAITADNNIFNSPERKTVIGELMQVTSAFESKHQVDLKLSGLPLIRTLMTERIRNEMRFFLIGSFILSALILLFFFRSLSAMLLSLGVVLIGVVWSVGILHLLGYKITLLTALIPPLIVVIGVPNCIYFLNKFHSAFKETGDKQSALISMISKMGVVTLFCNIAAAIGFAVFALTKSVVLQEFGIVAGISIMMLFFISLVLIPGMLKFLPEPKPRHLIYLRNPPLQRLLQNLEYWSLHHRYQIFVATGIIVAVAIVGMTRLQSRGYIVDDLPKEDLIYTDLKFFEDRFNGVMPLEIAIDTRRKYGVTRNIQNLMKIDTLGQFLTTLSYVGKPLSITEGLKFAKQAFFEGDSSFYIMPGENDLIALRPYLAGNTGSGGSGAFGQMLSTFIDSGKQAVRMSVTMKDVGTEQLPLILDTIQKKVQSIFDSSKYDVQLTGTSVTFLEGSRYIINGLKESIFWAFLFITLSMLYLFRSIKVVLCSLIPNMIPLIITAGLMGFAGVPLKPSTVLIFSVALGIAIDITIRFLVNYKQQLKKNQYHIEATVIESIHSTGLSIVYTSIVLTAGFVIFCFSDFGGTQALGWLTSVTLVTATMANLILLPALLLVFFKDKKV